MTQDCERSRSSVAITRNGVVSTDFQRGAALVGLSMYRVAQVAASQKSARKFDVWVLGSLLAGWPGKWTARWLGPPGSTPAPAARCSVCVNMLHPAQQIADSKLSGCDGMAPTLAI